MIDSEQVLTQQPVGLPVAGSPGHGATDNPPGEGPRDAGYGQTLALRQVHQDVVH